MYSRMHIVYVMNVNHKSYAVAHSHHLFIRSVTAYAFNVLKKKKKNSNVLCMLFSPT